MRELHDGVELLEKEKNEGPFVWRNWDKWVDRCEHVIKFLDHQIIDERARRGSIGSDSWMRKGFVCGVEWQMFRKTVEEYRKWLYEKYGGANGLRSELVFAHNDVSCHPSSFDSFRNLHHNILTLPRRNTATSSASCQPPSPLSYYQRTPTNNS